ncbi:MAG: cupin domain-containing protein, partial [Alphaproteobacteria bacterium]|nr:cupin domain-containing protein [Alphaproteobacteria bacterium]
MHDQTQDALSDILRLIRLKGCVYFQSDFSSPWGMAMGSGAFAQFHMVIRGQCWLSLADERHLLATGDVVVMPQGDPHALRDDPATETESGPDVLAAIQSGHPPFQDGEPSARLLCGHFEFDRALNHPLIEDLPRLIWIKGMGRNQPGWLEAIAPILVSETGTGRPGADTIVERLAEVLLIQVLRAHLLQQSRGNSAGQGFLAALGDRQINGALKFIHLGTSRDI